MFKLKSQTMINGVFSLEAMKDVIHLIGSNFTDYFDFFGRNKKKQNNKDESNNYKIYKIWK